MPDRANPLREMTRSRQRIFRHFRGFVAAGFSENLSWKFRISAPSGHYARLFSEIRNNEGQEDSFRAASLRSSAPAKSKDLGGGPDDFFKQKQIDSDLEGNEAKKVKQKSDRDYEKLLIEYDANAMKRRNGAR